MSKSYKVRITYDGLDGCDFKKCFDMLASISHIVVAGDEKGEKGKRHLQGWCLGKTLVTDFRKKIVRFLKEFSYQGVRGQKQGNALYSVSHTLEDGEKERPYAYIGYCMKEGKYLYKDVNEYVLNTSKEAWEEKEKKFEEEKKAKTKAKKTVCGQLYNSFSEYIAKKKETNVDFIPTQEVVIKFVIDYYIDNDKLPNESLMKNYCIYLLCKFCGYKSRLYSRLNWEIEK